MPGILFLFAVGSFRANLRCQKSGQKILTCPKCPKSVKQMSNTVFDNVPNSLKYLSLEENREE